MDSFNNTYQAMRILNDTHSMLYAEFTDLSDPAAWNFPEDRISFYEFYDIRRDPYQLHNLYYTSEVSADLRAELAARLQRLVHCKGQPECP